jgi:hypothetical protein
MTMKPAKQASIFANEVALIAWLIPLKQGIESDIFSFEIKEFCKPCQGKPPVKISPTVESRGILGIKDYRKKPYIPIQHMETISHPFLMR